MDPKFYDDLKDSFQASLDRVKHLLTRSDTTFQEWFDVENSLDLWIQEFTHKDLRIQNEIINARKLARMKMGEY